MLRPIDRQYRRGLNGQALAGERKPHEKSDTLPLTVFYCRCAPMRFGYDLGQIETKTESS